MPDMGTDEGLAPSGWNDAGNDITSKFVRRVVSLRDNGIDS